MMNNTLDSASDSVARMFLACVCLLVVSVCATAILLTGQFTRDRAYDHEGSPLLPGPSPGRGAFQRYLVALLAFVTCTATLGIWAHATS